MVRGRYGMATSLGSDRRGSQSSGGYAPIRERFGLRHLYRIASLGNRDAIANPRILVLGQDHP